MADLWHRLPRMSDTELADRVRVAIYTYQRPAPSLTPMERAVRAFKAWVPPLEDDDEQEAP